jgi:hypothetical protein
MKYVVRRARAQKKVGFLFRMLFLIKMKKLRGPSLDQKHGSYLRNFLQWKTTTIHKISENRALSILNPYFHHLCHKIRMSNDLLTVFKRIITVQRRVKCFL